MDALPLGHRKEQSARIVGFEMPVVRWEAKFKLGQNRSAIDRARTIQELDRRSTSGAANLAAFMRSSLKDG